MGTNQLSNHLMFVSSLDYWQRYQIKSRLLKFCYVPSASAASPKGIFVATTNSTNQTNKEGRYMPLMSLSFLDVYDYWQLKKPSMEVYCSLFDKMFWYLW
jgi:hypothetical protein